jgi:hypothetical protein
MSELCPVSRVKRTYKRITIKDSFVPEADIRALESAFRYFGVEVATLSPSPSRSASELKSHSRLLASVDTAPEAAYTEQIFGLVTDERMVARRALPFVAFSCRST